MSDDPTLRNLLRDTGTDPTEDFRTRLRHRLEHELTGTTVVEPTADSPTHHPWRSWRWIASAAAVAAVLVALVVLRTPNDTAAPPDTTIVTAEVTPPDTTTDRTAPPTTTAPTPSRDAALLAALTGSTWILTDAGWWQIPFPVPYLRPLPPGANGLVGTFDGCNGGSIDGVIEDGRLRITESTTSSVGCPDVEAITLPSESSLLLTENGRTLTITPTSDPGPMLTFRRDDALGDPLQADQLLGWWSAGDAVAASFGADGTLTAGSCMRSWTLDDSAVLSLVGDSSAPGQSCPARFLAAMDRGPFTARLDDAGDLWLLGDRTVLRLDPTDEPAPAPTVRWLRTPPIDVAPRLFPIDGLVPCEPGACPSVTGAPDGTIVSYDAAAHTITVGQRTIDPPRAVPIDGTPPATGSLVGIGPDDVAYLVIQPADAVDPIGDVIAVPLSGPTAGDVVARATAVADLSGDSQLVATRAGWVAVGCCGGDPVLPVPGQQPLLGWVDRTGSPIAFDGPVFSIEHSGDPLTFVRTEADGTRSTWAIPADEMYLMAGIPLAAEANNDSTIISWWGFREQRQRLVRLRADGGAEEILVPSDLSIVTLTPVGTAIVYDGASFQTWQLPEFSTPRDTTADVAELAGTDPFATPDELVDSLLRALSEPDGCEVAPTATVVDRTDDPDLVVTIAARYGCDDSGAGADIILVLAQDPDGSWFVESAQRRSVCLRGASAEFCV